MTLSEAKASLREVEEPKEVMRSYGLPKEEVRFRSNTVFIFKRCCVRSEYHSAKLSYIPNSIQLPIILSKIS